MGTNVFVVKKNPRKLADWKKLEQAVNNQDPWALEEELDKFKEKLEDNEVHLGKRSGGWRFLFDFQDWKYFNHTEESIRKFLEEAWQIKDEYERPMTVDEFWKEFALFNPTGWTGKTYEEERGTSISLGNARNNNYYESSESPAGPIPENLPYRFSNHKDFG